jgi:hypothetical protein
MTPTRSHQTRTLLSLLSLILATLALLLAGCTLTPEQKAKWGATGSFVASKAASLAGKIILNAAVSQFDGNNKADFLDSAAEGLRTQMTTAITSDDVAQIIKIWTPDKPHWGELASQAAQLYDATPGKPMDKVEAIASGLNIAAASQRLP